MVEKGEGDESRVYLSKVRLLTCLSLAKLL